jgi:hypothetical protein
MTSRSTDIDEYAVLAGCADEDPQAGVVAPVDELRRPVMTHLRCHRTFARPGGMRSM